ncbi:MAG TPA: hypothetical protein VLA44_00495 [Clostridia bacterium]|nr:hypothetical protein [Clostridia bacterium]
MHINRRFLGWGVFLILVGGIPLAVRAGWIDASRLEGWWNLWPLIVIGIGAGILLHRSRFELLGSLLIAATFGSMLGSAFASGGVPGIACGTDRGTAALDERSGTFSGAATIDVEVACGGFSLRGREGEAWAFSGTGDAGRQPSINDDGDSLRIRSSTDTTWIPFVSKREDWQLDVPTGTPLGLRVQVNAGDATIEPGSAALEDVDVEVNLGSVVMDLTSAETIENLRVQTNLGSIAVALPDASFSGRLQVNLGSIELCAPPGAALRIRAQTSLGSTDFGNEGLVQNGSTWETPGYDTAEVRIDLSTETNLGSLSLNPEDGCS